jgi:hypothetical protein
MTIWRMRVAFWTPKATNKHSEYVIRIAFPLQRWLYQNVLLSRYTYNDWLFFLSFQIMAGYQSGLCLSRYECNMSTLRAACFDTPS